MNAKMRASKAMMKTPATVNPTTVPVCLLLLPPVSSEDLLEFKFEGGDSVGVELEDRRGG